jgi:hypothetical protein
LLNEVKVLKKNQDEMSKKVDAIIRILDFTISETFQD